MNNLNDSNKSENLCAGIKCIDKSKFKPIENTHISKPIGGLWSSPYLEESECKSDWIDYCKTELPNSLYNYGVIFTVKNSSRGCVINSYEDLVELQSQYNYIGERDNQEILNFEKLSKNFDYIFLTKKGQLETRHTEPDLLFWDVETLLVFNLDCIEYSKYIEW